MKLIDTHAHLYYDHYDQDRDEMMRRTWDYLEAVVCVGANLDSSKQSIAEAAKSEHVWAAVGVHPHESHQSLDQLKELAQHPKVVAIGECGLDYKPLRDQPLDQKQQQISLRTQVELANELELPVIIHARDCWEDLIPLLQELKPNSGVVHSFSGALKEANELIKLGLLLSFSGIITYPANEAIREVVKLIPIDKFVIETDAPYLPPQPKRGQRNEPAFVKMTAERIAEVRGISLDEVAESTNRNAVTLFRLPL